MMLMLLLRVLVEVVAVAVRTAPCLTFYGVFVLSSNHLRSSFLVTKLMMSLFSVSVRGRYSL